MRLVSITIENFRSITKAYKVHLHPWTVLIGPNNEGKSNILRALAIAMETLTTGGAYTFRSGEAVQITSFTHNRAYKWETDFPIQKQKQNPDGESVVLLEFELTPEETDQFKSEIKSDVNGTLPIRVALRGRTAHVTIAKKGRGAATLTRKSGAIAQFIVQRLEFRYIPTVRDAETATKIVTRMLDRELQAVERDAAYKEALDKIAAIQKPILDQVSASIQATLVTFLPKIKDVTIAISSEQRLAALRRAEIYINDGTKTNLRFKGDGVQSLAAIALMRHASELKDRRKTVIIAVEEPESHLHPSAIHNLRAVLRELAQQQQIVITTHCPLFVDRTTIGANIIVNKNVARVAQSAQELRSILGVRAADNLMHAELVLLVEGEEDKAALSALLPASSPKLKAALDDGALAVDSLGGGSNVTYKAGLLRDSLCVCHCFLDFDKAGCDGFEKAKAEGLLTDSDVNFATCDGMAESEMEDLYDADVYKAAIHNSYRVSLESPKFKNSKKWSERMRDTFKHQGKNWTDILAMEVKRRVASVVVANPTVALNNSKRAAFDALVCSLEQRIDELHSAML